MLRIISKLVIIFSMILFLIAIANYLDQVIELDDSFGIDIRGGIIWFFNKIRSVTSLILVVPAVLLTILLGKITYLYVTNISLFEKMVNDKVDYKAFVIELKERAKEEIRDELKHELIKREEFLKDQLKDYHEFQGRENEFES